VLWSDMEPRQEGIVLTRFYGSQPEAGKCPWP
jgi:hypothetical protein